MCVLDAVVDEPKEAGSGSEDENVYDVEKILDARRDQVRSRIYIDMGDRSPFTQHTTIDPNFTLQYFTGHDKVPCQVERLPD